MKKLLFSILGLALVSSSCRLDALLGPPIPMGAEQMQPLPEYSLWWNELEECTGKTRNFNEVTWWKMPVSSAYAYCSSKEIGCTGFYDDRLDRIYISEFDIKNPPAVSHEILHALGLGHKDKKFEECVLP